MMINTSFIALLQKLNEITHMICLDRTQTSRERNICALPFPSSPVFTASVPSYSVCKPTHNTEGPKEANVCMLTDAISDTETYGSSACYLYIFSTHTVSNWLKISIRCPYPKVPERIFKCSFRNDIQERKTASKKSPRVKTIRHWSWTEWNRWADNKAWVSLIDRLPWWPKWFKKKKSAFNAGDPGLIPALERSSRVGNGNLLRYSCLENPMDRGTWRVTVHGVTKSRTRLSNNTFQKKYIKLSVALFFLSNKADHVNKCIKLNIFFWNYKKIFL